MEDIKKTSKDIHIYFDKNKCLQTINTLQLFYKKNIIINQEKESLLWKRALDVCMKKKCPPGFYNLYDECISG